MDVLPYVTVWVLFSVTVGIAVGYVLGRNTRNQKERHEIDDQRATTLNALVELLKSTEQLTTDVDSHNSQMHLVSQHVGDLQLSGEMQVVQRTLLEQITHVMESNQRLEDDLVVARSRMEAQAEELDRTRIEARTDVLSGALNRKAFDEKLHLLLTTFRREHKPFVLVLGDIDHFKRINDTHGHPAGDGVVTNVGAFLHANVRPGDYVARYGGDEFALLLPETELEAGVRLVEAIRAKVSQTNFDIGIRGEQAVVTFSIGVAAAGDGDSAETLILRADRGLYRSKQGGRNQVNCELQESTLAEAVYV